MAVEVYCKDCKWCFRKRLGYYEGTMLQYNCHHPKLVKREVSKSAIRRIERIVHPQCSDINSKNDCTYFEQNKRRRRWK